MLDGHHSETLPLDAGVPQGSFLEPLLFLVHLDDMVIKLACAIRLYADDACLIEIVDSSPAVSAANTPVTHTRRTAHALSDKN